MDYHLLFTGAQSEPQKVSMASFYMASKENPMVGWKRGSHSGNSDICGVQNRSVSHYGENIHMYIEKLISGTYILPGIPLGDKFIPLLPADSYNQEQMLRCHPSWCR